MNNGAEHQRGGIGRFLTETAEWNALMCSMAFFFIFTAFGTVQNYATSLPGNSGAISLAILYLVLTFSNIFIPAIAGCMSPRWAMFLGSATYAMYVAANIHEIDEILCFIIYQFFPRQIFPPIASRSSCKAFLMAH